MKLPDFEVAQKSLRDVARESYGSFSTEFVEAIALAMADILRERGRPLGIEGDGAHHHDALRSIECLATSARTVESIRAAKPANDNATGE